MQYEMLTDQAILKSTYSAGLLSDISQFEPAVHQWSLASDCSTIFF